MNLAQEGASPAARHDGNRRLALRLAAGAVLGVGFAFAQVPLYRAFCEWTGINDIARPEESRASAVAPRLIGLEFDANEVTGSLRFQPKVGSLAIRTGDLVHVTYVVENRSERPVIGQAIPSYGPGHAGQWVRKLDCFCFRQQRFEPHEVRELPVVFTVDTALPDDVATITLSYTFFEVPMGRRDGNGGFARG